MNRQSQKGSALLIVLGFLSFMVVSAVAFAIWMRTERLPSSALRRTVANRYLVKAALAQAMSRVDDAVRSHVFPGAWYTNQQNSAYRDKNGCAYDWWESRVFMPPDPEGRETSSGDPDSRYAPVTKTVSVLNLEALGYLPPSIANDVRLLARSSWAAQWDYFNFDAGRYAFCAVNVSDFLDITKIAADAPRTSAAAARAQKGGEKPMPSRFSLAYLFRSSDNDFTNPNGIASFDQYVHTAPGQGQWTSAPLVSLMDYNLSVGENTMGNLYSPFVEWVAGFNNTRLFYRGTTTGPGVKGAERQPFVTDSWFPQDDLVKIDGTANTPLDLSCNQPFKNGTLKTGNASFATVARAVENNFWTTMMYNGGAFSFSDFFSLFDYLDEDDVPVSLAFPCVERVPMLAGLEAYGNLKVEFSKTYEAAGEEAAGNDVKKISEKKIKVTASGMGLGSLLVFPFKGGPSAVACEAQAFGRLVFVASNGDAAPTLSMRNTNFARNFRPMNEAEWTTAPNNDSQFMLAEGAGPVLKRTAAADSLVVTLPSRSPESWTPQEPTQSNWLGLKGKCWEEKSLAFADVTAEKAIIRKNEYYRKNDRGEVVGAPYKTTYQILLRPFDVNGNVIDEIKTDTEFADEAKINELQYKLRPCLVAWARIKQDGKMVDMVPATYEDDKAYNNIDNNQVMLENGVIMEEINVSLGNFPITSPEGADPNGRFKLPILGFQGKTTFKYSDVLNGADPAANEWEHPTCYALDPRFNWAPENWWFETGSAGNSIGEKWYRAVFENGGTSGNGILDDLVNNEFSGSVKDRGDRARKPFLFVSNLGYLQSVGELAFLPRLTYIRDDGQLTLFSCLLGHTRDNMGNGTISRSDDLYNGVARVSTSVSSMPCALAAWKFYQNYRTNRNGFEFGANLYRRGLINGSQGFYVNPYAQSQEVMLAALANTPLNYWVAGTNVVSVQDKSSIPVKFNDSDYHDYMFAKSSPKGVDMSGQDLNKIALFLRHRFEDLASMITPPNTADPDVIYAYAKVWEDLFDALDWGGSLGDNYTVRQLYEDLESYFDGGGNGAGYGEVYKRKNKYGSLNLFVKGNHKGVNASFTLNTDRVVHKDELDLPADPLRAETQVNGFTGGTSSTFYDSLSDVDRMFLHSYWRDCFANKQQLFLIFVRAESTALGGAGEGTPAQQGGRAVALVWRDPMPPTGDDIYEHESNQYQQRRHPHKMRVLFYRQFD